MHTPLARPARRSGFTLMELLTVIVIIAILAGLLFPVLNRSKDRAYELAAKDLCAQVATAWNELVLLQGRFPSEALISEWAGKNGTEDATETLDGDLVVAMTPGATSVLNWWVAKSLVPGGDKARFQPTTTTGNTELKASDMTDIKPMQVEFWPVDKLLERTFVQKCIGLYAPWIEREFRAVVDGKLFSESSGEGGEGGEGGGDENGLAALQKKYSPWMVHAVLDMDGDGILHLPDGVAAAAAVSAGEDGKPTIRGTSAAWVPSKDGRRLLTSW